MFTYLESGSEVKQAQQSLQKTVQSAFRTRERRDIGHAGGVQRGAYVHTDKHYWYWTADLKRPRKTPRRQNWFGLYKEDDRYYLHISVEINTAYKGRIDSVAGFFARNTETGAVYLFHSGRVGGGTKGVGKTPFLAFSNRRPATIVDSGGNLRDGVLVMPVEGPDATRSLTRYIDSVAAFKRAVRDRTLDTREYRQNKADLERFFAEARGRRKGRRSAVVDYVSRHGDIVDALYAWRRKRPMRNGARIVKNVFLDLGVKCGSELREVFEVKTSSSRSDVYAAVGQLMVHGANSHCLRTIVLPKDEPLAADLKGALQRLGIRQLSFRLTKHGASVG